MAKINKDHLDKFFVHGLDLDTRTYYFGDAVTADTVADLIKGIHVLEHAGPDRPILILMNNGGGSWDLGIGAYDIIRSSTCEITIRCAGHCMSMASVILQAADIRESYPNTEFMIHDGTAEDVPDRIRDLTRWAEREKRICESMYRIFAERSKHDVAFWRRKCADDYILTADEALELGLIDRIVGVTE